jgi:multisubunit Na+/H+ antiporter MnhB subunit
MSIQNPGPQTGSRPGTHDRQAGAPAPATRHLLTAGMAAGPVFLVLNALQAVFRDGFDLSRQPLSLLSLGDHGWIQITNFVLTGALSLAGAAGLRRVLSPGRGGTWGPALIAVYGLGLITAAVFRADPSMGFPAGAPEGNPVTLSTHALLHGVGAMAAFSSLTIACLVLARRFAESGQRGWAGYSVTTALLVPVVLAAPVVEVSIRFAVAAVITSGWLTAVFAHLRSGPVPSR